VNNRATQAAQELAAVLLAQAENLASNDLTTIATAMTAVRAAAREVEAALTERGWGGEVLYGFGEVLHDDEDDDLDDDALAELDDLDEDEDEDENLDSEGNWVAPPGTRMTYQARYDYVVVDEEAFLNYVERRAAEAGESWTREDIVEHTPAYVLAHLEGFANKEFEGSGIVFAGGQDAVHEVPITLWEMDDETRDDRFPTAM
jgi:hypothetical protein